MKDVEVTLITDGAGFAGLQTDWQDLMPRAAKSSVFMSWEWQFTWWQHYGQGQALRLLVARRGDCVVGILPLYLQRQTVLRLIPVRILRNVGTGGDTAPDDLDALIDAGCQDAVAASLVQAVFDCRRDWDLLRLAVLYFEM